MRLRNRARTQQLAHRYTKAPALPNRRRELICFDRRWSRDRDVREAWNECICFVDHFDGGAHTSYVISFVKWWFCSWRLPSKWVAFFLSLRYPSFGRLVASCQRRHVANGTLHMLQNWSEEIAFACDVQYTFPMLTIVTVTEFGPQMVNWIEWPANVWLWLVFVRSTLDVWPSFSNAHAVQRNSFQIFCLFCGFFDWFYSELFNLNSNIASNIALNLKHLKFKLNSY